MSPFPPHQETQEKKNPTPQTQLQHPPGAGGERMLGKKKLLKYVRDLGRRKGVESKSASVSKAAAHREGEQMATAGSEKKKQRGATLKRSLKKKKTPKTEEQKELKGLRPPPGFFPLYLRNRSALSLGCRASPVHLRRQKLRIADVTRWGKGQCTLCTDVREAQRSRGDATRARDI